MEENPPKVSGQVFKWFERMKASYDLSIQNVLTQFESNNQVQQGRMDEAHKQHIAQLQRNNEQLSKQYESQIEQLNKDVDYYRQQIDRKQETIESFNTRYDTVLQYVSPAKPDNTIKEIFSEDDFLTSISQSIKEDSITSEAIPDSDTEATPDTEAEAIIDTATEGDLDDCNQLISPNENPVETSLPTQDELFDQAILQRKDGACDQAFVLFEQAAKRGHVKSMGAMGRSFFLGEGTEEDPVLGLAWLINAANNQLPQAIDRVKHFAEHEPVLYEEAMIKIAELM